MTTDQKVKLLQFALERAGVALDTPDVLAAYEEELSEMPLDEAREMISDWRSWIDSFGPIDDWTAGLQINLNVEPDDVVELTR